MKLRKISLKLEPSSPLLVNLSHNLLGPKHFSMSEGLCVGRDPSSPPILHKFRDVEKDKWVDPKGFKT